MLIHDGLDTQMIREAFRGGAGCLGWVIMAFGLLGAIAFGVEDGIRPVLGVLCLSFLPGLILVTICHRDKKRQLTEQKARKDDDCERQEEGARRRAQEEARRTTEEKKRKEEEQRRREEEQRRARSSERPTKDERYYATVLGLKGSVGPIDVRRKYRELVAQYHPDRVNHLGPKLREVAEREMKAINEAYEFFRREYNI